MKIKDEFVNYLKSIGITKPLFERIEIIYDFFVGICPDTITDIFISEAAKKGETQYSNLWFFSEKYAMEAKQFIGDIDDFDIMAIEDRVIYLSIKRIKYDFVTATKESRVYVSVGFKDDLGWKLRASQENCDYLRNITKKYVLVNLKE